MLKAYKYRIYPTKSQRQLIEKTFGCVRFYWNKALEIKLKALERREKIPQVLPSKLKKEYEFLREVDSLALANAQLQLEKAIKYWLSKKAEKPKFKRKKDKQTYTTNNVNGSISVDFEKGLIKLPKLGYVKTKLHRNFEGTIRSATIRKSKTGKYFVSILVEEDIKLLPEKDRICAIDLGLKHFATICYSDGSMEKVENPKYLVKTEKRLAREQGKLSRKQKGSKNYEKQRLKVARLYEKVKNQREDFLHKLSKRIVSENQAIVLEDLNVNGLLSGRLSKHIQDSSWRKFIRYLSYKALWYGRELIFADRFYPSSKTCHVCGYRNQELKLSDREWVCPVCSTRHDRDINAGKNLLLYGVARLRAVGSERPELMPVERWEASLKQEAPTSISGSSSLNQIPYVIALNSNDSILARIFTLFHEYAHLLLGITEIYNDEKIQNKEIEEWCNSFAAEFLLPSKAFETDPDLQKIMELKIYDDELISKISKTYKVSKMLVIIRLKTLGIIDEKTCKEKLVELKTVLNNRKVKKEKFARNLIKECIKEKGREFLSLLWLYRSFNGDKRYIIENLYKRVF